MPHEPEEWMARVRLVAETLVKQHCKQEEDHFEIAWEVFAAGVGQCKSRIEGMPGEEGLHTLVQVGLGFARDAGRDLVTPRVLATASAAVFDAAQMQPPVPIDYVRQAVQKYGESFGLPSRFWLPLVDLISLVIREDFAGGAEFSTGDIACGEITIIRWDSPERKGRLAELTREVERVRSEKMRMDLFLDDLRNEFLVNGKQKNLPPMQRHLLVLLFTRVGDYWQHSDLFCRLWGDDLTRANTFYQLLNRLHRTTGGMLKPFLESPQGLERCYVKDAIRRGIKYALVFVPSAST